MFVPFKNLFVLWMPGVTHRLKNILIAGKSAAILWRTGLRTTDATRVIHVRLDGTDLLHFDVVQPIVSHVVDLAKLDAPLPLKCGGEPQ